MVRKKVVEAAPLPVSKPPSIIAPQPVIAKPPTVSTTAAPKTFPVPLVSTYMSTAQKDIDSFVKVVSPPPPTTPQLPPVAKISGPSFASALAAASSGMTSSSSSSIGSITGGTTSLKSSSATLKEAADSSIFAELETFLMKKFPSENLKRNTLNFMTSSYQNLPDNYELERTRQYSPKQPYAMPSFYQSDPPQILNNPSIFERFDLDTLFFIFYYQQKTYPQ